MSMTPEERKAKSRAYYLANRERLIARQLERDRCRRSELLAYKRAWHAKNRERIAAEKRAKYEANKAEILAGMRVYYEANNDRVKARVRAYHHANKSKILPEMRERGRRYRDTNRERWRAKNRAYAAANPDKVAANIHRRRARLKNASVGDVDFAVVRQMARGVCGICGDPIGDAKTHYDHIVPLARGGAHCTENLQLAHAICNLKKGAQLEQEVESERLRDLS